MDKFTIPCTKEQTKKAFELGAPGNLSETLCIYGDIINKDAYGIGECTVLHIPTAEEMVGWLEEQGLHVDVIFEYCCGEECYYYAFNYDKVISDELFMPRKLATLAAIDAALEYLIDNRK